MRSLVTCRLTVDSPQCTLTARTTRMGGTPSIHRIIPMQTRIPNLITHTNTHTRSTRAAGPGTQLIGRSLVHLVRPHGAGGLSFACGLEIPLTVSLIPLKNTCRRFFVRTFLNPFRSFLASSPSLIRINPPPHFPDSAVTRHVHSSSNFPVALSWRRDVTCG